MSWYGSWLIWIAILVNFILLIVILVYIVKLNYNNSNTNKYIIPPMKEDNKKEEEKQIETEDIIYDDEPDESNQSLHNESVKEGYYKYKGLIREQLVCQTLEKIYQKGFPTTRPSFLVNPETGELLEYDCYNPELKIAGEHNGIHHYQFPNRYHKTRQEFEYQVRRDQYKKQLSDKNDVYLITAPYWVPTNMIPSWVEYYCPETVSTRQNIENLLLKHK